MLAGSGSYTLIRSSLWESEMCQLIHWNESCVFAMQAVATSSRCQFAVGVDSTVIKSRAGGEARQLDCRLGDTARHGCAGRVGQTLLRHL